MENNLSLIFIIAVTFLTTKAQGLFNPSATLISDDSPSLLSSRKPHILEREKEFPWRLLKTSEHETILRGKRRGLPSPSIRRRPTFINECVHVVARSGTYVVRKELGSPEPCGIYIAGYFNETIIVDVSRVDVTRDNNGVVAFFDGWEMNGYMFPSLHDHQHALNQRVVEMTKETFPTNRVLRLRSSQNVALIQYRIPRNSQGFIFRVSYATNDDPCNVLMLEEKRLFTMSNNGHARNCTVTSVFTPPNLKLKYFQIGTQPTSDSGLMSPCVGEDYMDIGGSSTLDPTYMEVKESICGREPHAARQGLTVLCDSSSIRLVSSGRYENVVSLLVKKAEEEDFDYSKNIIMMCPEFNF